MKYINLAKNFWEESYSNGYGDVLSSNKERTRYEQIVNVILNKNGRKHVLDLGCGTGLLENLLPTGYTYTGVDFSQRAIDTAILNKKHVESRFFCDDICSYDAHNKFDIIVFNETLYYISDPCGVVQRFSKYLSKDGLFIISIYTPGKTHPSYEIFDELCKSVISWGYDIEYDKEITSGDIKWRMFCLKK